MFKVVKKEFLNEAKTICLFEIEAPLVARHAQAGQFVIFRLDEQGERTPVSVAGYDREKGTVTVMVQAAGRTTRMLHTVEEGDYITDFVGPLGHPTVYDGLKKVCVSLLNYGAAAQTYFKYNLDNMMNADLSADQQTVAWSDDLVRSTWTVDAAKEGGLKRQNPPVNSRAGALELEGAINVKFTGGITGKQVAKAQLLIWNEADFAAADVLSIDNATEVVDMTSTGSGKYQYIYEGVAAKHMFKIIYACQMYTDVDGNVYYGGVLPMCAERYAYMNKAGANGLGELVKAMVVYGDACRAYFPS